MNIEVYDNCGETLDRYTVIAGRLVYSMSIDPNHPQGFNQYSHTLEPSEIYTAALNEVEVKLADLPKSVQEAINDRILTI